MTYVALINEVIDLDIMKIRTMIPRKKKGQSLVEFSIILPILILVVMGILEFGMMLNTYLAINNAVREGARIGSIGGTDTDIRNTIAVTSPTLGASDLTINITPVGVNRKSGDTLTVAVQYNYHVVIPIISNLLNKVVVLNAQTSMRVE